MLTALLYRSCFVGHSVVTQNDTLKIIKKRSSIAGEEGESLFEAPGLAPSDSVPESASSEFVSRVQSNDTMKVFGAAKQGARKPVDDSMFSAPSGAGQETIQEAEATTQDI